jgi:hypothetical protein
MYFDSASAQGAILWGNLLCDCGGIPYMDCGMDLVQEHGACQGNLAECTIAECNIAECKRVDNEFSLALSLSYHYQ